MEALSSVQRLGGDVELAVGLSTVQHSRVFEVVNKIQIHAPLELSVLRTAAPLELLPHRSAPRVHSRSHRSALVFLTVLLVFLTVILSAVVLRRAFHPPLLTLSPPKHCTLESVHAPPPLHVPHAPPHVLRCHLPLLTLLTVDTPLHIPHAPPHAPRTPLSSHRSSPCLPRTLHITSQALYCSCPSPLHVPHAPPHVLRC